MRIRIKQKGAFADTKIDALVKINDVLVKEDLIEQKKAHINLFFKGRDSSGIISLGKEEAKNLADSLSSFDKLAKNVKRI